MNPKKYPRELAGEHTILPPRVKLQRIHTTLTTEEVKLIIREGWPYNELIRIGIQTKQSMPNILERIENTEKTIRELKEKWESHSKEK